MKDKMIIKCDKLKVNLLHNSKNNTFILICRLLWIESMFLKFSQRDAVFDVKVVVFLWGWGRRVGLCKSSVSEAVGKCKLCLAVPGLALQMKGVMYVDVRGLTSVE